MLSHCKRKIRQKDRQRRHIPFSGVATALSGTVGTGNIAGVALAVHLGGRQRCLDADDCIFKDVYQIREETLSHKYRILMKKGW